MVCGFFRDFSFCLRVLIFFFLLDLLAISDSAGNPRAGMRRGELWLMLAFNISTAPFQLVCELERMSRGMTIENFNDIGIFGLWAGLIEFCEDSNL